MNSKFPKYIGLSSRPAKRLFNADQLNDLSSDAEVLICEGEFDTMMAFQNGCPAVGVPGVHNFPITSEDLLKKCQVFLCLDNDEAGKKGMQLITNKIGSPTTGIFLKEHKDLTEYFSSNPNGQLLKDKKAEVKKIDPERNRKSRLSLITAREIQRLDLPPIEWIVKDLLPVGLSMLVGPPKIGKSFLALNLALSISDGCNALGYFDTNKCKVLYVALEDGLRRINARINIILSNNIDNRATDNLVYLENPPDLPKINDGGIEEIGKILDDNPEIKLVIIDTYGRCIADKKRADQNIYLADYKIASGLQLCATEKNICILIIHHTKKGSESDPFDEISGTRGLPAAADTLLVMKKEERSVALNIRGRDINEEKYDLIFDEKLCVWNVVEKKKESNLTPEREEIIELLEKYNRDMRTGEMADLLNKNISTVSKILRKLLMNGVVTSPTYGTYKLSKDNINDDDQ